MRRWILFFLLIFFANLVIAPYNQEDTFGPILDFQHEEIQVGETIIATIYLPEGEFTRQISKSDITFLEGRKEISLEYNIQFYNGTHYLYIYATRSGDFKINIKNILYKISDSLNSLTIEKDIQIKNFPIIYEEEINESGNITLIEKSKTQILSIKPGFIFTSKEPSIKLSNIGDSPLNLQIEEEEIILGVAQTFEKNINTTSKFSYLNISTYKEFIIPIILISPEQEIGEITENLELRTDTKQILKNLIEGEKINQTLTLFNFAKENITINKISSDIEFLEIEKLESIEAKTSKNITLKFFPKDSGHFKGKINITYAINGQENLFQLPLSLFILPVGSTSEDFEIVEETCAELKGKICSSKEKCEGKINFTKEGVCCSGTCILAKSSREKQGYGWLIGILILGVLGTIGYLFYKKLKNVEPKKPEDKLKESSEKYLKRVSRKLQRS